MLSISWYLLSKVLENSLLYSKSILIKMTKRGPMKITRTKNVQKLNFQNWDILKVVTYWNHWLLVCIIESSAGKQCVAQTILLKLGGKNNAQLEMVRPTAEILFLIDICQSSDLYIPDSSYFTCCCLIVNLGNPIWAIHLQVLIYATVVYVLEGFPQFSHCPQKVTFVVKPHLLNVGSSSNKLS